ncbi:hypothetical protein BH10ACT1_BH10ACT1_20430 [soil metagenome]
MRKFIVVLFVVAGLAGSACTPTQLEIDLTVRRTAVLDLRNPEQVTLTLTGVLACSGGSTNSSGGRPANGEPLDMFGRVTQSGMVVATGNEADTHNYQRCSLTPRVFTITWDAYSFGDPVNGPAKVTMEASTNPGERVDEAGEQATDEWGTLVVLR